MEDAATTAVEVANAQRVWIGKRNPDVTTHCGDAASGSFHRGLFVVGLSSLSQAYKHRSFCIDVPVQDVRASFEEIAKALETQPFVVKAAELNGVAPGYQALHQSSGRLWWAVFEQRQKKGFPSSDTVHTKFLVGGQKAEKPLRIVTAFPEIMLQFSSC
ncbi:hypothetical protein D7Y22_08860 [Stenotrophomonas maltophilia]|nr:hypothetical protein [Stenotrophomonas maltophilia]